MSGPRILTSIHDYLEVSLEGIAVLIDDPSTPDSIRLGLRAAHHNIETADLSVRGCLREYEMRGRPRP